MNRIVLFLFIVAALYGNLAYADGAPDVSSGYVSSKELPLPNSAELLPAPPGKDSAIQAADAIASLNAMQLRGSKRWLLAVRDANLSFPAAAAAFSCAVNLPIDENTTPHLYTLLRRTLGDAANANDLAKKRYNRPRPFTVNQVATCTPNDEQFLRGNGSYPSGHSAIGWAWALILAEIVPERLDAILQRGLAFGDSRVICNVHWQSDVQAGRIMGASVVARLHTDQEFMEDLKLARKELARARERGLQPDPSLCATEGEALRPQ